MAAKKPTTRKRTTRKPTDEQAPEVKWEQALIHALTVPGSTGSVYSRFHRYSYLNTILLMMQGATEPCASYNRWKAMGRQVRKGEKGLYVNRPIQVRLKEKDANGNDQFFQKFKMVKGAFQASQTDGPDLPDVEIPEWNIGRAHTTLALTRVDFRMIGDGNVQGHSRDREYAINPVAVYPDKTRMHEIAHIVLGHTSEDKHGEYATHRGLFEFEAEATAFLVCKELGILPDDAATVSRGYIQGWLQGQHPGDAAIRRVFKAVNEILNAGRPAVEQAVEEAA